MKHLMILFTVMTILFAAALAEPEEQAAVFVSEYLPEYTFVDGVQFDETAMLLVEDEAGLVYFAG